MRAGLSLGLGQLHPLGALLVERVQRVAARHQAGSRGGGAVAERPADQPRGERATGQHVGGQLRIRQHHAAQADQVGATPGQHRLRHVGQPLLEVGVAGPDDGQIRMPFGHLGRGGQQASDPHQRILGRGVAVRRREVGRTLHVRAVVGTPGGDAHQTDPQLGQHVEQPVRLGQVDAQARAVAAEGVARRGRTPPAHRPRRTRGRTAPCRTTTPARRSPGSAPHRGCRR